LNRFQNVIYVQSGFKYYIPNVYVGIKKQKDLHIMCTLTVRLSAITNIPESAINSLASHHVINYLKHILYCFKLALDLSSRYVSVISYYSFSTVVCSNPTF